MRGLISLAVAAFLALAPAATSRADDLPFEAELEIGSLWQSRNKAEIPNDGSATRFSLKELAGTGPWAAGRVYVTWNVSERHGVRLLAARLSYSETAVFDRPVSFAGETFSTAAPTEGTYRFNSWRATYRYRAKSGERWTGWIGATAKVRDAKIGYDLDERWRLNFRYRTVEGGVDVDEVYNFAWFHAAVVSGSYRWGRR